MAGGRRASTDFSRWALLGFVALIAGVATALLSSRWLGVVAASGTGTVRGWWSGALIWPPHDGIAASYSGIVAIVAAPAAGLVTSLVAPKLTRSNPAARRARGVVMACCLAVGR